MWSLQRWSRNCTATSEKGSLARRGRLADIRQAPFFVFGKSQILGPLLCWAIGPFRWIALGFPAVGTVPKAVGGPDGGRVGGLARQFMLLMAIGLKCRIVGCGTYSGLGMLSW